MIWHPHKIGLRKFDTVARRDSYIHILRSKLALSERSGKASQELSKVLGRSSWSGIPSKDAKDRKLHVRFKLGLQKPRKR